jgi:transposase InsO family protein
LECRTESISFLSVLKKTRTEFHNGSFGSVSLVSVLGYFGSAPRFRFFLPRPTHKNIMTTHRPLELLHIDLFGPIAYISIDGSKYCLVIVDDYSRFTWVFFLQDKSQTQETLKGFLRWAQNEFGLRIKKIRSDNETEFKNSQIEGFLEDEGIKHEFSSPYTPQQNGVVERKKRTLLDMARTMLDEYKTSDRF